MENTKATQNVETENSPKNSGPLIIAIVTIFVLTIALWQFFTTEKAEQVVAPVIPEVTPQVDIPIVVETPIDKIIEPQEDLPIVDTSQDVVIAVEEKEVEVIKPTITLPPIDESDSYIETKLPTLTWRNELLSLIVTDDIVRRFVVFTDNFAQGLIAYEHSLFTKPAQKFTVDEESQKVAGENNTWIWESKTSQRFDLYVDLLRTLDSNALIELYIDIKPLIDESYGELGYEEDFTLTLQDAITRVLDMEFPQSAMNLTRSSVMYKFQDPAIEALSDSDKLLLRLGKENLLIIKSVLLELSEKLDKRVVDNK